MDVEVFWWIGFVLMFSFFTLPTIIEYFRNIPTDMPAYQILARLRQDAKQKEADVDTSEVSVWDEVE